MTREEALAILEKANMKPGDSTAGLKGGKRAEVKTALNFLARNPEPAKKKRASKKKKND